MAFGKKKSKATMSGSLGSAMQTAGQAYKSGGGKKAGGKVRGGIMGAAKKSKGSCG